jgi:glycosyltransferase involved in cell wall biosynthesis
VTPELDFVVPGPLEQLTGGYVYASHMVTGLRDLGWTVRVHDLPGRFPDPDAAARCALDATLAALQPDSRVLVDGLAMGGLPEPVEAHAERLRILSLVHHPLADETGLSAADKERFLRTERRALARCAGVLVTSEFTARSLAAYGVPAARLRVVPPGTARARLAIGSRAGSPPSLLCLATITPRKGHEVLVEALGMVRDLAWTCVCAGSLERDPGHASHVRGRVARLGLGDRVAFVGERRGEGLESLYHGADVFVLATHFEGYGMVLAEALARGLPIVSTTGGAVPFTVPGDAAILVPPGDAAAFADALRRVLDPSSPVRAQLAAAARRHAESLPTWPESASAFARAIEELTH